MLTDTFVIARLHHQEVALNLSRHFVSKKLNKKRDLDLLLCFAGIVKFGYRYLPCVEIIRAIVKKTKFQKILL